MWFQYFIHGTVLKEFVCPRAWEVWKKHPVAAVLASIGGSAFFFLHHGGFRAAVCARGSAGVFDSSKNTELKGTLEG